MTVPLHCGVAPGNLCQHPWLDQRRLTRHVENEATALRVGVDLANIVATTLGKHPRRKSVCDVASPQVTKVQIHTNNGESIVRVFHT